jgi:uncharacterized RDD family membrane protein YckC
MSVGIEAAEQSLAVEKAAEEKEKVTIIGFDAERLRAPFILRCTALLLDYLLIVVSPVISLMLASSAGAKGANLFKQDSWTFGLIIALITAALNLVVLPLFLGRTLGKLATGLRIVEKNGDDLSLKTALIRFLIGIPVSILTGGIGFVIAIFDSKGRTLHDLIAGTVVVQGRRKRHKIR